jgi:hypothetical protein
MQCVPSRTTRNEVEIEGGGRGRDGNNRGISEGIKERGDKWDNRARQEKEGSRDGMADMAQKGQEDIQENRAKMAKRV